MDIKKLYEKVINSEDLQGIPIIHILRVFNAILDAISDGDCFYKNE